MKKVWLTLYDIENVHLTKDVGAIPFGMYKYCNYDAYISVYGKKELPNLKNAVSGLKTIYIPKLSGNFNIDAILFLKNKGRKIDVLNVYHPTSWTALFVITYKRVNPKGIVYLKCDCNASTIINRNENIIKKILYKRLYKRSNLISIETFANRDILEEYIKQRVHHIPNPIITKTLFKSFKEREKIIFTAGRLGTYEKATEILIESFCNSNVYLNGWKLRLAGSIEKKFYLLIDEFKNKYPDAMRNVEFLGNIEEHEKVMAEYQNAKICCMPSRHESFCLSFLEGCSAGNFMVGSKIDAFSDMTNNWEYGRCFEIDNCQELSQILSVVCNNEELLHKDGEKQYDFANTTFDIRSICYRILDALEENK